MGDPATGVSEGYVLSMGVQLTHRLRVSFHEFTQRLVILLNYLVKYICRSHLLEITSLGLTHPFPRYPAIIHARLSLLHYAVLIADRGGPDSLK